MEEGKQFASFLPRMSDTAAACWKTQTSHESKHVSLLLGLEKLQQKKDSSAQVGLTRLNPELTDWKETSTKASGQGQQ